jgi:hypothetical protein
MTADSENMIRVIMNLRAALAISIYTLTEMKLGSNR